MRQFTIREITNGWLLDEGDYRDDFEEQVFCETIEKAAEELLKRAGAERFVAKESA